MAEDSGGFEGPRVSRRDFLKLASLAPTLRFDKETSGEVNKVEFSPFVYPSEDGIFLRRFAPSSPGKFALGLAPGQDVGLVTVNNLGLPDYSGPINAADIEGLKAPTKVKQSVLRLVNTREKQSYSSGVYLLGDSICEVGGSDSIPSLIQEGYPTKKIHAFASRGYGIFEHKANYTKARKEGMVADEVILTMHISDFLDKGRTSDASYKTEDEHINLRMKTLVNAADNTANYRNGQWKEIVQEAQNGWYFDQLAQFGQQLQRDNMVTSVVLLPTYLTDQNMVDDYTKLAVLPVKNIAAQLGFRVIDLASQVETRPTVDLHPDHGDRMRFARDIVRQTTGVDSSRKIDAFSGKIYPRMIAAARALGL